MNLRFFCSLWVFIFLALNMACGSQGLLKNASSEIQASYAKLDKRFNIESGEAVLIVDVSEQKLYLVRDQEVEIVYSVSTSVYGVGSRKGSQKTPLGTHRIVKKFGNTAPLGTVFKSGINTRKIATIYTDQTDLEKDEVTTRVLWLRGLDVGKNQGPGVDSEARRIYIHGTPEEGLIGRPASHGCIRMKNKEVIELYNKAPDRTLVEIQE